MTILEAELVSSHSFSLPLSLPLQDGSRGHLEGLASVYCELLMAPFGDVLGALEQERIAAWLEISPSLPRRRQRRTSGSGCGDDSGASSSTGGGGSASHQKKKRGSGSSHSTMGLPNSHSQPIYVPGKYSVSNLRFQLCIAKI